MIEAYESNNKTLDSIESKLRRIHCRAKNIKWWIIGTTIITVLSMWGASYTLTKYYSKERIVRMLNERPN